jgi:hypothetical protein
MMRWLLLLLLLPLASQIFAGDAKMQGADALDAEEQEERRTTAFMVEAAEYRLGRATAKRNEAEDAIVLAELAEARHMATDGGRAFYQLWLISPLTRARWMALDTFEAHPYSSHAGPLIHFMLDCRAQAKEVRGTLTELQRLWYYLPEYGELGTAMSTALDMAVQLQRFETAVDLDADDPSQVVKIEGRSFIYDLDDLFRFLAKNGNRDDIAPLASLALARSLLLSGDKDDRWKARRAYEDFLERFPDSPLVFEAVLEQALSHLVTYKGSDYDVGALLDARDLVDIAELEAGGDPARAAKVAAYRKRIGSWLRDRDLSVARWYAERTRPSWLAWLKRPIQLKNPDDGARYYASAVIRRDRTSRQAAAAQALLDNLPAPAGQLGR